MINLYIMRINLEFSCPRNRRNLSNIFASKNRQKRVYLLALGAFPINSIVLYVVLFILHAFNILQQSLHHNLLPPIIQLPVARR